MAYRHHQRVRVTVVGGGLAGLATAAGLTRSGHDVAVIEQADGLRASGLALNLWSNATTLLPHGVITAEEQGRKTAEFAARGDAA